MANKTAVVIVVYNIQNLIAKQVECIRKYCKDDFDIVVIDNSSKDDVSGAITFYLKELGLESIKVYSAEAAGSRSNSFACNIAYTKLKDKYDLFLYLDHDTFPIRDFSVKEVLGDKLMAGVGQEKGRLYFQQTSLMWNNALVNKNLIDFSCNNELGLDTGGNLYKLIEESGKDNFIFFNEKYYQNPYFREGFYNFYATVNDDMFMHFINSSNWNPISNNEERINSLINVLNERISIEEGGTYTPIH